MGAHSTVFITRQDALAEIFKHLTTASEDELEDVLYGLFGDRYLYNYSIVDNYEAFQKNRCYHSGLLG